MAEITKMKEVNVEFRKIYELIEHYASERRTLAAHIVEENKLRMDAFQQNWESFMQTQHSNSNQSHGSSSNVEHPSFPGSSQVPILISHVLMVPMPQSGYLMLISSLVTITFLILREFL